MKLTYGVTAGGGKIITAIILKSDDRDLFKEAKAILLREFGKQYPMS